MQARLMPSVTEMLGRLAVGDPDACPRARLQGYASTVMKLLAGA